MSSQPQRPSVIADEELVDGDRRRSRADAAALPTDLRPAFEALFQVDAAMGDVVARATQPALGAVKLAWWRERLEELDQGMVPAEPRLRAVAEQLLPRGISGAELSQRWRMAGRRSSKSRVEPQRIADRGALLFRLGGRLLGADDDQRLADAGALVALVSVGRRRASRPAGPREGRMSARWSGIVSRRRLRPLTGLARLAVRDLKSGPPFEPEGAPPRVGGDASASMERHRYRGD